MRTVHVFDTERGGGVSVRKKAETYWKKIVKGSSQDAGKTEFSSRPHAEPSDFHGRGDCDHPDHCRLQCLL